MKDRKEQEGGTRLKQGLKIAIDGPVAVGKSTVGTVLSQRLGYLFIDTGSMYRAFTWKAIGIGASLEDEKAVARLATRTDIELRSHSSNGVQETLILVDGVDVTRALRLPEVDRGVSLVARVPEVRRRLVSQQRKMAKGGGVVMVGRDIGTVVLPDADVKVFLEASPGERARRRYLEMEAKGEHPDYGSILDVLLMRDRIDTGRDLSPLRPAEDARIINTEGLTPEQVVEKVLLLVEGAT